MSPIKDIITPSTFLFDAISTNLFICLCILAIEIIVAHIAMVVCMIKYRLYRRRYQSLRDLKKFKGNYSVLRKWKITVFIEVIKGLGAIVRVIHIGLREILQKLCWFEGFSGKLRLRSWSGPIRDRRTWRFFFHFLPFVTFYERD